MDIYNNIPDNCRSLEEIRIIIHYLSDLNLKTTINIDDEFDRMIKLRKEIADKLTHNLKSMD